MNNIFISVYACKKFKEEVVIIVMNNDAKKGCFKCDP